MKLDIYKIDVNENDETGMKAISFVNSPAINSNFLKFDKENKKRFIALKNEEFKQVLAGLALIPNQLIYRYDSLSEYEYFVYFDEQSIVNIRNKFHKEKNTDMVNLQHDNEKVVNAYLIESYIINSEERLNEVKSQGIVDAVMGSWYVQYKVEDSEVFQKALDGDVNGFSIEIVGNYEQKLHKNNNNNKIMSKFKELINKFKNVLAEFDENEITAKITDTERTVVYTIIGEPVYEIIIENEEETKELLDEGTYILDNELSIVVDENGNLSEIKDDEVPVQAIKEEDLEKEIKEENEENSIDKAIEGIEGLIPKDDDGNILDGSYSVEIYVNNGQITYGSLYAYSYKDLELAKKEISKLQNELNKLLEQPMAEPLTIVTEVTKEKLTKEDMKKMTNIELISHKLGII